ncbi:hypothetical protein GCM10009835_15300 [Planosporangium flavigriseum]
MGRLGDAMAHDDPVAESTAPAGSAQPPSAGPATSAAPGRSVELPLRSAELPLRSDMVGWAVQRVRRRRNRISAEIERNRRGEPVVPTWVLTVLLAVILGGWLALVVLS